MHTCTLHIYIPSALGSQGEVRLCLNAHISRFFHDTTHGGPEMCLEQRETKNVIVVGSITLLGGRYLLLGYVQGWNLAAVYV